MYSEVTLPQNNYQAGFILGEHSRKVMHNYVLHSKQWNLLKNWIGSNELKKMESIARSVFPQYIEELIGIADGCNLPFSNIFLWNCRGDFYPLINDGCTSVFAPSMESLLIGHNEDGDPRFRNHWLISKREPEGSKLGYISFTYPASINGHAFALNSAGLIQVINNIRSLEYSIGVPRQLLSRAILDSCSLDDAISVIKSCDRSGSFHHLIAQVGHKEGLSIEYTPQTVSILPLHSVYGHANHFIHPRFDRAKQLITQSSAARQDCIDELFKNNPFPTSPNEIKRMLWSTANPDLPVYRSDPNDPDGENNLASVVFSLKSDTVFMNVYVAQRKEKTFNLETLKKTN
jgi:hypothetical protein